MQTDPLHDARLHDAEINPELQEKMNKPPVDPGGLSPEDETFLHMLLDKISSGAINVFTPSSLYNEEVVDKLDPEHQAKVETKAHSMLATIRQIESLWEYEQKPTYAIVNLIKKVRLDKEAFELAEGDVFII